MHELSLCQRIINIATNAMPENTKIVTINLEIGALILVEPKVLVFMFNIISKNTAAADAKLMINFIEAKGHCDHCGMLFIISKPYASCVQCGNHEISVLTGNELSIKSMEVKPCVEPAVAM